MSLEFNGKYWRINDLAEKLGLTYGKTYSLIANRDDIIKIGMTLLIPDMVAKEIISSHKGNMAETMSLSQAAQLLGTGSQTIYQLLQLGLPYVKHGKKKRIEKHVYEVVGSVIRKYQEQYSCIPEKKIKEIYDEIKRDLKQA